MVKELATVVAVDGMVAWVETTRQSSCSSCSSSSSCGTSTLAKVFGSRPFRVEVTNPLGAKVGEQVTIAVSESGLMMGAALLYLIPLLALFLSALLGEWIMVNWLPFNQEWLTVLAGLTGALFAVLLMRSKGWFERQDMVPVITEIQNIKQVNIKIT